MKQIFDLLRAYRSNMRLKSSRGDDEVLTSRIVRATTERTLMAAIERLAADLDVALDYVPGRVWAAAIPAASGPDAPALLAWLRRYPRIAAMIAMLRDEADYEAALEAVDLAPLAAGEEGHAPAGGAYQIQIRADLLSGLAHGGDAKAGNATLFRRCQVLSTTGAVLDLPFYAGNAVRGQIRDLLADHLLRSLGITPSRSAPPIALWFFHGLYAGGVLEEGSKATQLIRRQLGDHGAVRSDGINQFRTMLPGLSLLGVALGNRVIPGRIQVGDMRPRCKQWGTGEIDAAELMEWTFLTRREDHEDHADGDHHGMIATTETLRAGAVLDGGIDVDTHASDLERAALGCGLALLQTRGTLGAETRRGLGRVALHIDGAPDPAPYLQYLADNRDAILGYLESIGALDTTPQEPRPEKPAKAKKMKAIEAGPAEADPNDELPGLF